MPACSRHHFIAASGSSQVENATGGLPCLRREKRSSSAAATISPSTTSAAAGSWNTALTPRTTAIDPALSESLPYQKTERRRDDSTKPAWLRKWFSASVFCDRPQALERATD